MGPEDREELHSQKPLGLHLVMTPEHRHNLMMRGLHFSVIPMFIFLLSSRIFSQPADFIIFICSLLIFSWISVFSWDSILMAQAQNFGELLEEIFFFLITYSFMLLSLLDNTPKVFLAQILFFLPIFVSLSTADLLRILLAFMWAFFLLNNAPTHYRIVCELELAKHVLIHGHCFLIFIHLN